MSRGAKVKLATKAGKPRNHRNQTEVGSRTAVASRAFRRQGESCVDDVGGESRLMVVHCRHAAGNLRHGADLEACCVCYLEIETIKMEHFMLWMGELVEAALDVASISVVASEGLRQRGTKHMRTWLAWMSRAPPASVRGRPRHVGHDADSRKVWGR